MNEYDSDKMADVLHATEATRRHQRRRGRPDPVQHLLGAREGAGKVFSDLGRVKHLKAKGVLIGVGGCVASQEGAAIIERAPYVDVVFGPQTLHRLPDMLAAQPAAHAAGGHQLPEIEKFDHLPPPRARARERLRVDHGRLLQILQLLRGALHARRGGQPPVRRRAGRGRRPGRPGRQGSDAARPERQRLPRRHSGSTGGTSEIADFAPLEYVAEIPGIERIRYTTSHPNEFTQRLIDVYARAAAGQPPAPAGAAWQRPHPLAAKRGYTAMEYKSIDPQAARVRPGISLSSDFIVGFPARPTTTTRSMKLIEDVGFDASFSFIYSARPGTPAANLADDTPQAVKLQRLQELQAAIEANARRIGNRASARGSASWSKGRRAAMRPN